MLLLSGKANVHIRDDEGLTPMHVAMKNGTTEVVSYIANTGKSYTIY